MHRAKHSTSSPPPRPSADTSSAFPLAWHEPGEVDCHSHLLIYSSAGHPPPILLHPNGTCELLDQATDPPLGARPEHVPRPQATTTYTPGDTLILYTDGLIERRGEDIEVGLTRLTSTLATCTGFSAEHLADTLLARLDLTSGANDDIAIVIVRLPKDITTIRPPAR